MQQLGGSSVKNFSVRWGIGVSTTWRLIQQGVIRVVKIGGNTRIPHSEELRLLEQGGIHSDGTGEEAREARG